MSVQNSATTKMIQNVINGTTPPQQAVKATQDGDGNIISSTYAKQSGTYPNITAGNATHAASADTATNATNATHATTADSATTATNATNATNATKATQDGNSRNIVDTYAEKVQLPNPNLLLNPDWRVNQKGQVLYNNSYNNNYTYDRWNFWCDLSGPNISRYSPNDFLSFVNVEGTKPAQIVQYIDPVDVPLKVGEYYTMSAEYTTNLSDAEAGNFTRISRTFTLLASGNSGWIDFEGTACDLICGYGARGSAGNVYSICLRTTKTIYVRYIKLEQGQAATDFIPPIYSEELAKCQRYYYQIEDTENGGLIMPVTQVNSGNTDRRGFFQFPVRMRRTPTVTAKGRVGTTTNVTFSTEYVSNESCMIIRNAYTPTSGYQGPILKELTADAEL